MSPTVSPSRHAEGPGLEAFRDRSRWLARALCFALLPLAGCRDDGAGLEAGRVMPPIAFREGAALAGLDFHHFNGRTGEFHMAEVMGAGVALLDYDGDGDLDIFFIQGAMLDGRRSVSQALDPPRHPLPLTDRLYRNDTVPPGSLHFVDVTEEAGLSESGYGMGVAVGDYDRDGRPDLYITRLGPNQLLRNRGDGSFEDVTALAGVGDDRWNVAATFFDYDRDGELDLFVGGYLQYRLEDEPECSSLKGRRDYCGASHFSAAGDRLFHNRGDGTFEDFSARAGLKDGFGPALGALATDLDDDGWPDLYVANDAAANNFWHNRGDGTFEDRALLAGLAFNGLGRPEAGMGVDAGDYDNDGDPDLFVTHLITETDTLYRGEGAGLFSDRTDSAGLGGTSRNRTAFGTGWADLDNDGWLDLVVVAGAVQILEPLAQRQDPFPLHEPNHVFLNLPGDGSLRRFVDLSAGAPWTISEVSRGMALGDLDNDGDLDLVITNNGGPARLLVNEGGHRQPWLGLQLSWGSPGTTPIGATATLRRDIGPDLHRRVRVDGGYASAHDPRILFGLGEGAKVRSLEIRWPDGSVETYPPPALGRYHEIRRGEGQGLR